MSIATNGLNAIHSKRGSSPKLLAVDSVLCWKAYGDAVSAIDALAAEATGAALTPALNALGGFADECAAKAEDTNCGGFLTTHAEAIAKTDLTEYKTKCVINEPTTDATDCPSAYEALITALQALSRTTTKVNLRAAPADQFNAFVTKCAKTSHEANCLAKIKDVDTTNGPAKTALADIQASCNPSSSGDTGGDSGDDGVKLYYPSLGVLLLTSLLFHLSYLI
jgi:hypothetical protein